MELPIEHPQRTEEYLKDTSVVHLLHREVFIIYQAIVVYLGEVTFRQVPLVANHGYLNQKGRYSVLVS